MREDALLHANYENDRELQPLRVVKRHEGNVSARRIEVLRVIDERDPLEEIGQGHGPVLVPEVGHDAQEFLQVLDAALGLDGTLRLEVSHVTGAVPDLLQQFMHLVFPGELRKAIDELEELADLLSRPRCKTGNLTGVLQRVEKRDAVSPRISFDGLDGRLPYPSRRDVDDAPQAYLVPRVRNQAQVSDDVLDLGALVETGASEDAVWDSPPYHHLLDDPRLRVRAIEDSRLVKPLSLAIGHRPYLAADKRRLAVLVGGHVVKDLPPRRILRPEHLVLAAAVVLHHRPGRREDVLGGGGIMLELDHPRVGVILLELEDVPDVRAAPGVYALVVVAYHAQVPVLLGEHAYQLVLHDVGVLVFVDKHVPETLPVILENLRIKLEQVYGHQQKAVEVQRVVLAELLLVSLVDLGRHLPEETVHPLVERLLVHHLVLCPAYDSLQRAGMIHPPVEAQLFEALDYKPQGVHLVEDREARRVTERRYLPPQDPRAGGVKRPNHHVAGRDADKAVDPLLHLVRRLVCKGDGDDV